MRSMYKYRRMRNKNILKAYPMLRRKGFGIYASIFILEVIYRKGIVSVYNPHLTHNVR